MNDKEKLQYLYEKEKAKEEKQERKQGQALFAGGMVAYLFIAVFKIVVMSFFPLLFFYFILGIGGMSLIILSLIAGAVFFYIKEGQDVKEEMGNRAMMDEVRNERLSYSDEELEDDTTEVGEKEMSDRIDDILNSAEEQKEETESIGDNNNSNWKSLTYLQKSIANGFLMMFQIDKAFNNMPIVKSYIEKHGLKSAEEIPYLRENFYIPVSSDTEKSKKIVDKYGYFGGWNVGAVIEENNKGIAENWEKIVEIDDNNLLRDIFDQAILEAVKTGARESYYDIVCILENLDKDSDKDFGKHFDFHSEKEWISKQDENRKSAEIIYKLDKKRFLTEEEKRERGLIS